MKPVDVLSRMRSLESALARRVDTAARRLMRSGAREPLEILHAILDAVDREIQAGGRGTAVFPFNAIHVSVLASSRDARQRLRTVLTGASGLQRRISDTLASAGCSTRGVAVTVSYVARAQSSWRDPEFHVRFATVEAPAHAPPDTSGDAHRLDVLVSHGIAEKRSYSFAGERIDIGRCGEVKDAAGRLVRTNDVAFVESSADVNASVSRQHAHITHLLGSREFRLFDDGSVHGTYVVRRGRMLAVPRGARGVRLVSGDEIRIGDARLRIRITP